MGIWECILWNDWNWKGEHDPSYTQSHKWESGKHVNAYGITGIWYAGKCQLVSYMWNLTYGHVDEWQMTSGPIGKWQMTSGEWKMRNDKWNNEKW